MAWYAWLLCRPDHLHTTLVITWRDPPGWFDEILLGVMKYGVLSAGIIFFAWGVGYKLAFWGQGNSDAVFVSAGRHFAQSCAGHGRSDRGMGIPEIFQALSSIKRGYTW
jgi:hypothetical protein